MKTLYIWKLFRKYENNWHDY